jgi:copper chaperone CopZ
VKTVSIELPTLYGDHHVVEVRRMLLELPGVSDVYASSAFRMVEVTYDPGQTNDLEIKIKLDEAGYLGEWSIPAESGTASYQREGADAFFRHTQVFETTRQVVSFAQKVNMTGRPLWTCPGMGVVVMKDLTRKMEE